MANFVVPTPLNLSGNIAGNWKKFKKSFNIYMESTTYNKEAEERQIAILLNLIGQEAVELQDTFKYEEGEEKKISAMLIAFENYCIPKKNILHARFLFYNRKQKEGEVYDSFLTDCKTLIQACEFSNQDEILRDKIVLGANDRETMEVIIKMEKIGLDEAIEKFRVAEIIRKQIKQIHAENREEINLVRNQKKENEMKKEKEKRNDRVIREKNKCRACGGQHDRNKCPARGKQFFSLPSTLLAS